MTSYVLDWIIIFAIAFVGFSFGHIEPYKRPFSLIDLSISYPLIPESVTPIDAVFVVAIAPAAIIAIVVLVFVPGPAFVRANNRSQVLRLKFWELERGVAGLAMSIAITFFVVQGIKNLVGKPRPNLLARCDPDLDNIASHVVGGMGRDISVRWTLVTSSICRQQDQMVLNDGFRSFPSGHSSFAWAGLLYLTFFLCSKFAIAVPFLEDRSQASIAGITATDGDSDTHALLPMPNNTRQHGHDAEDNHAPHARDSEHNPYPRARINHETGNRATHNERPSDAEPASPNSATRPPSSADFADAHPTATALRKSAPTLPLRNRAAAPPNHLLVFALVPVAAAIYICTTRYSEYYHFGFDIIFGSLIGILCAWFSFRWYHLPIRQGAGWAWGARSRSRAFGVGVGTRTYVGKEGWDAGKHSQTKDLEAGTI